MAKIYERVNWENLPSKNTPVSAENLNKMDEAIDKLDDKIVELEEGSDNKDYLEKNNPSGTGAFSMNRKAGSTVGDYSVAIGGADNVASGKYSYAEGGLDGMYGNTSAKGVGAHVEGGGTIASGNYQHVQGVYNIEDTEGKYAHIVGNGGLEMPSGALVRRNIHTLDWEGNAEFAGDVTNGNGVSLDGLKTLVEEKTNTNDMTLTYTEAEELTELTSGEKLTVAFGKLAKAVKEFISHLADKVAHITSEERSLWNTVSNKADKEHAHNYAGSSSAGGSATTALACTGNAATATKAIQDGNGNIITETYAKKSIYDDTSINLGRKADTTIGLNSVALGIDVTASRDCSHAEGRNTEASGSYSHAEGYNTTATNIGSHAEGSETKASGGSSHAEGYMTKASGSYSHAEGSETTASGSGSHAEGSETTASGSGSHAEGYATTASGDYSHAEGYATTASGDYSHAEGNQTTALTNQHAQGHYNDTALATANSESGTSEGTAFVIGNGTYSATSNAFRVTGKGVTYAKGAYNSTGADYAEFAEWADGNPNNEDRRGYFVTFDEEKPTMIRKANAGDYVLGIVSGNPCIIGNADEGWLGKYIYDEYGSIVYEDVEIEESYTDETGEEKTRTVKVNTYKINPEYDATREYIHREKRKEWAAIGWIGVLSVRDDGSCIAGGYCKVTDGGIATKADRGYDTYRVIKRVTDNVIKIALK